MRLIVFPGGEDAPNDEAWAAELDAALSGRAQGSAADCWRELREDVRSLAPPISGELIRRLESELAISKSPRRLGRPQTAPRRLGRPQAAPRWLRRPQAAPRWLRRPQVAAAAALVAVLLVAAAVVGFARSGGSASPRAVPRSSAARPVHSDEVAPQSSGASAQSSGAGAGAGAGVRQLQAPQAAAAAPGREQQLAASVTLTAPPAEVQSVAGGVALLAVRDEGVVEDSHVQVQQRGSSEATLTLRLPSARLSAELAAIGRLAPVSSESQSLQDITGSYDSARQRLADASAERAALLRALARATTEGQIDSLRERLAQARDAIARASASLRAVSERASTAEVEVTITGDSRTSGEGLTLDRGVHDAGRVLTVAAIALLIAAAVLVPLALALAAAIGAHRLWRRHARERALRM